MNFINISTVDIANKVCILIPNYDLFKSSKTLQYLIKNKAITVIKTEQVLLIEEIINKGAYYIGNKSIDINKFIDLLQPGDVLIAKDTDNVMYDYMVIDKLDDFLSGVHYITGVSLYNKIEYYQSFINIGQRPLIAIVNNVISDSLIFKLSEKFDIVLLTYNVDNIYSAKIIVPIDYCTAIGDILVKNITNQHIAGIGSGTIALFNHYINQAKSILVIGNAVKDLHISKNKCDKLLVTDISELMLLDKLLDN